MANSKINKVNTEIVRTKEKITDYTKKLRDLEQKKISLENEEIVALFRREKLNEDEFAALLRNGRLDNQAQDETTTTPEPLIQGEEEHPGDYA